MLWAHPGKPRETQRHGPPADGRRLLVIRGQQDASPGRHHVGAGTPSGHATHADTAGTVRAQIMAADLQGSGRRLTAAIHTDTPGAIEDYSQACDLLAGDLLARA